MPSAHWETVLATALCAAAYSQSGLPQPAPTTILQIDVENQVEYDLDVSDLAKWASDPNVTRSQPPKNFDFAEGLADIVAVNGQQAKGTLAFRAWALLASPAPTPGSAIADVGRLQFEISSSRFCKATALRLGRSLPRDSEATQQHRHREHRFPGQHSISRSRAARAPISAREGSWSVGQ